MKKTTPWFPASIYPTREGVYETQIGTILRRRWDGRRWTFLDGTHSIFGRIPYGRWRGLASKP